MRPEVTMSWNTNAVRPDRSLTTSQRGSSLPNRAAKALRTTKYRKDPRVLGKDGVQVTVSMPVDDFAALCELARRMRVSRSQLVRDLVREKVLP